MTSTATPIPAAENTLNMQQLAADVVQRALRAGASGSGSGDPRR